MRAADIFTLSEYDLEIFSLQYKDLWLCKKIRLVLKKITRLLVNSRPIPMFQLLEMNCDLTVIPHIDDQTVHPTLTPCSESTTTEKYEGHS